MVGGKKVIRERMSTHGTGVQDSPWIHIGLGNQVAADLKVTFPGTGAAIELLGVPAGSHIKIIEDGTVIGFDG